MRFSSENTYTKNGLCDFLYDKANHLGNVLTVVSDKKIGIDNNSDNAIDYYLADVVSATDYGCFGNKLAGRHFTSGTKYPMSFNGKRDDEETGTQDYGMRIYNPNLGRFLSVDPITKDYPELTPYQFASNTPIQSIDLDGLEEYNVSKNYSYSNSTGQVKLKVVVTFNNPYYPGATNNQRHESVAGAGDQNRKADITINGVKTAHNSWPTTFGFMSNIESQKFDLMDDQGSTHSLPLSEGKGMRFTDPQRMGARFKDLRTEVTFNQTTQLLYNSNMSFGAVATNAIDSYVNALLSNPELTATVTGNTSRLGTAAANSALSQARVNDVMTLVVNSATAQGASPAQIANLQSRITTVAAGETNSTNTDGTDVPTDRNVTFSINLPAGTTTTP